MFLQLKVRVPDVTNAEKVEKEVAIILIDDLNIEGDYIAVVDKCDENGVLEKIIQTVKETDEGVELAMIEPMILNEDDELENVFTYVEKRNNQRSSSSSLVSKSAPFNVGNVITLTLINYYEKIQVQTSVTSVYFRPIAIYATWTSSTSNVAVSTLSANVHYTGMKCDLEVFICQ